MVWVVVAKILEAKRVEDSWGLVALGLKGKQNAFSVLTITTGRATSPKRPDCSIDCD